MDATKTLEIWIERYSQSLVRLAYSYSQDWSMAEDHVQNSFIKAFYSMNQLNSENPYPWLAKIVINESRAVYRKKWREYITSLIPERAVESSEESLIRKESDQYLHDLVLKLPERYSVPIILYYFDNLSVEQVAQVIGISQGTVKSRLSRGREKLKNQLGGKSDGEPVAKSRSISQL
jgi:RNA polymerase sigma-70 factor (ECF subfamily)